MAIDDELATHLVFDTRLDAYASFFDHEWSEVFGSASDTTTLRVPAFDLTRDWKGVAVAARMPWLMIESLKGFHEGFTKTNPPFYKRLTTKLGNYILNKSTLSNMRKKEMMAVLHELRADVEREMENAGPAIDRETIWQEYLQVSEFPLALWNSQRIAYGAVYYAYENFVQRAVAAGRKDEAYRAMRFTDLTADFRSLLGETESKECLERSEIDVARLVRNCLAHDGGRVSKRLRAKQHSITVTNGELQVMPHDVRRLFDLLKGKALRIVQVAATLPQFSPTA